ncbi:uncharacterized protein [Rutidosis leptorrhynchoides]|uniref:uncharacterized protein n=1 Tax=Rutidosis leptorrhynchoides TaxID=125765 RepID=UPI003A99A16E
MGVTEDEVGCPGRAEMVGSSDLVDDNFNRFSSVKVGEKGLEEFSSMSGLFPNLQKSTIFFGSVHPVTRCEILDLLPFKVGSLPLKYLGVPLISKRLGIGDCKCLVDKVKGKINCWRNKSLSYAGRLQLINSVLSSMQVYWASVYFLPQAIIKDIESLLMNFLWANDQKSRGKAKVAWKLVCRPKKNGGLGLRLLSVWNKVLLMKQVWKIVIQSDSIWWQWLNVVKLKGKNFWDVGHEYSDSWGWNQLLSLRDEMKNHMTTDQNGVAWWLTNDNKKKPFSSGQAWKDLGCNSPCVDWYNVVWFPQNTPKHAFIMWLAMLKRLTTQDRLKRWYPDQEFKCSFCGKQEDSHAHLFFKCDVTKQIWENIKGMLVCKGLQNDLVHIVQDIARYQAAKDIRNILNIIVIGAVVYSIWMERNRRIFRKEVKVVDVICKEVKRFIQDKLSSLIIKNTKNVKKSGRSM